MTDLSIKAVDDKVIGIALKPRQLSLPDSKIVLPTDAIKPQMYVKVLSVGEKVENIKEGDVIVCHPNGGQLSILENYMCKILTYGEIYGVLEGEEVSEDDYQVFSPKAPEEKNRIVRPNTIVS